MEVDLHPALLSRLGQSLGSAGLSVDRDVVSGYETDWTGRFHGDALAVALPESVEQVVAIVDACRDAGVAIVPQGGNTGLVGGSVPRPAPAGEPAGGSLVVSTRKLNRIGEIDPITGQVTAGAGVTLKELQDHVAAAGFELGLDYASRDSATVGGAAACDAGGARALAHGTAGTMITGIEAVLGNGTVFTQLRGLAKDNAGYDLTSLLIGSEGTLGLITAVRWQLRPGRPLRAAAFVTLPEIADSIELITRLRPILPSLESFDFMLDEGLQLSLARLGATSPVPASGRIHLLIECADRANPFEDLVNALDEVGIEDAAVVDDTPGRNRIWASREHLTEAITATHEPVLKFDVSVATSSLERFLSEVPGAVAAADPAARTVLYGHLGDGNVHVNVIGGTEVEGIERAVLGMVIDLGGSISAEHGVGSAKSGWLEAALGPDEVENMRRIKRALDPEWILNPGVIYP